MELALIGIQTANESLLKGYGPGRICHAPAEERLAAVCRLKAEALVDQLSCKPPEAEVKESVGGVYTPLPNNSRSKVIPPVEGEALWTSTAMTFVPSGREAIGRLVG